MSKRGMKIWLWSALASGLAALGLYLFLPPRYPDLHPADFEPLSPDSAAGKLMPLSLNPAAIYGMGLTYSTHIRETASPFDPSVPPLIFRKAAHALGPADSSVPLPGRCDLIAKAEALEDGLGRRLEKKCLSLPLLLDYEAELAFVLLSEVDWSRMAADPEYLPDLGYFIANDVSVRALAILGERKVNKADFWGASKSFPGFLPVGKQMWVPQHSHANSLLVTTLTTTVNGEVRQRQSTSDLIYTPKQMLNFIAQKYPDQRPRKGDVVLTGTPGGVALQIPYWKVRLGNLLRLDALTKLSSVIRSNRTNTDFIRPGDTVVVSGGILGTIQTRFVE